MEKILNTNQELEQSMLGWIIKHNDLFFTLAVEDEDFAFSEHKLILNHISASLKSNLPVTTVTLKRFFETLPRGKEYLTEILQNTETLLSPSETLKILRELRRKRSFEAMGLSIKEKVTDASKNSQEIEDYVLEQIEALQTKTSNKKTVTLFDAVKTQFSKEKPEIYYSGYRGLDDITGGFEAGDLIILAGRPAMGKSALAVSIALLLAEKRTGVLIISLEMNQGQVARRIIANLGSLNITKLKYNSLTSQHELESFQKAASKTEELPIFINDEGGITLPKVKYEIKKFLKKGVKVVVIDYIQLIKHQAKGGIVEKITEISNGLKSIALELGVVIIGLSQLSRAVEQRDDKRPQLSDLRDSGSIEQDANMVIFAFRPEYYLEKQRPEDPVKLREWENEMNRLRGVAYAIVSKNRDGKCGEAKLHFDGEFGRFTEIN